jgi:hypothetical protein
MSNGVDESGEASVDQESIEVGGGSKKWKSASCRARFAPRSDSYPYRTVRILTVSSDDADAVIC